MCVRYIGGVKYIRGYHEQWRGGSEAAGEAPRIMAPPPPNHAFLSLGLGRVLCRRHNMHLPSVIAQYIWVDGALQAPQQLVE